MTTLTSNGHEPGTELALEELAAPPEGTLEAPRRRGRPPGSGRSRIVQESGEPDALVEDQVSNDGDAPIAFEEPYLVHVKIEGTAPILFHRWSVEDVEAKGRAAKGSATRKSDNIEAYVYRDEQRNVCLPGEYFRNSIIFAAKFRQDPRSPRKSAMDLFKAGVISLTDLAPIRNAAGQIAQTWDAVDRRRVMVQRNGVTRDRPSFHAGWSAEFDLEVLVPEYISPQILHEVIIQAGKLIGIADFRPSYGRYLCTHFERVALDQEDDHEAFVKY